MFLDTSFCVDFFREQNKNIQGPATNKLKGLGEKTIYISVFVLCELESGARLSKKPENELKKVEYFASLVEIMFPDRIFTRIYGEIESYLRKKGTLIPTMDLLIGVTAKQYGMSILTRDSKHFDLIPGLIVEAYF